MLPASVQRISYITVTNNFVHPIISLETGMLQSLKSQLKSASMFLQLIPLSSESSLIQDKTFVYIGYQEFYLAYHRLTYGNCDYLMKVFCLIINYLCNRAISRYKFNV